MSNRKFEAPFVIQLRQYVADEDGKLVFYTNDPDAFAYTNEYRDKISLRTTIGLFIASLAAPDINTITDLVEMGKTLEERSLITFPGTPTAVESDLEESYNNTKPLTFVTSATYANVDGKGNPLQLVAHITDHPLVSFMKGKGKKH